MQMYHLDKQDLLQISADLCSVYAYMHTYLLLRPIFDYICSAYRSGDLRKKKYIKHFLRF